MARTHAAEERDTYAVTSRNARSRVARGVLCESAPGALLLFDKHISASVNQHATIEEAPSCGSAPRLYNEDLTQLELRTETSFWSWQLQQGIERVGSRR
jgi:hypothetical protein